MTPVARAIRFLKGGRGVGASVLTAITSRALAIVPGLLAPALALQALGAERFGGFLVLMAVASWLSLGSFGIHSALGRAIASGELRDEELPGALGAALSYSAITSILIALAVGLLFHRWLVSFAPFSAALTAELQTAVILMLALCTLNVFLQPLEGVNIGRLRIYITNLCRMAGSIFSIILLLTLPRWHPTIGSFIVAVTSGLLFGTLIISIGVVRRINWNSLADGRMFARLSSIIIGSLPFLLINIASLVQTQWPIFLLSHLKGAEAAVDLGLIMRLLVAFVTVLTMITGPSWPAITKALSQNDMPWLRRTVARVGLVVCGFGLVAFLSIAVGGARILHAWTGRVAEEQSFFFLLAGAYFVLIAWAHFWAITLLGLGRIRLVAVVFSIEAVSMILTSYAATMTAGAFGLIGALVFCVSGISALILPLLALRQLRAATATP